VMGLYMLVFVGGTPIGAPIIGAVTSHFGARTGMLVCGVVPVLAAVIAAFAGRERSSRRPVFNPLVGRVSSGSASTS